LTQLVARFEPTTNKIKPKHFNLHFIFIVTGKYTGYIEETKLLNSARDNTVDFKMNEC
jgi:hypothetical protein